MPGKPSDQIPHPSASFHELVLWFGRHCNGDWEHGAGISIETLDNPGWRIRIDLKETELETRTFEQIQIERSNHDWLRAWVGASTFNIACGALNVEEAIQTFLDWAAPL